MKHVTRWSPDTCGCIIEYEWDDKESEEVRKHTFKNLPKACIDHDHHVTGGDVFEGVLEENRRKNQTFGIAKEVIASLEPDEMEWVFDENRNLVFHIARANASQRSQIVSRVTSAHGERAKHVDGPSLRKAVEDRQAFVRQRLEKVQNDA